MILIAIEGGDAVGKATQSKLLRDALEKDAHNVRLYAFPRYASLAGSIIKRHLTSDTSFVPKTLDGVSDDAAFFQAMMLADKSAAAREISGDLVAGRVVIADRWIPSALVYGESDGLSLDWLESIHSCLPVANVNILLDASAEVATSRRPSPRDRYEEDAQKRVAIAASYRRLWHLEGKHQPEKWPVVPAERGVEEVHTDVLKIAKGLLKTSFSARYRGVER